MKLAYPRKKIRFDFLRARDEAHTRRTEKSIFSSVTLLLLARVKESFFQWRVKPMRVTEHFQREKITDDSIDFLKYGSI